MKLKMVVNLYKLSKLRSSIITTIANIYKFYSPVQRPDFQRFNISLTLSSYSEIPCHFLIPEIVIIPITLRVIIPNILVATCCAQDDRNCCPQHIAVR